MLVYESLFGTLHFAFPPFPPLLVPDSWPPPTHAMTPQQQLIDYVDLCLSHGHIPVKGPQPDNAEIRQEWEFIQLALEAIRCHALFAQVRAICLSQSNASLEG
jgi:hypothetical protein